jgi:3'-5' exoribonuclease
LEVGLQCRDMQQRRIPSGLQFSSHQSILGVRGFVTALYQPGLITCLFEFERKGLHLRLLLACGTFCCLQGSLDRAALDGTNRSGELDGKVWDNPETVSQSFERDDVVKVRGTVEVYNDKPQIIVSRIRRCEPKEYNAADFYASSARDPEEMFGELQDLVSMVRDEALRRLSDIIANDPAIGSRLKSSPAAMKIHHAFRGGLLEHILSLCNLSVALCAHYPRLNLDLLIAGAILHDLGKIETLELTGLRFTYTTRGQLIEHVTLGLEILERHASRIPDFPVELKTILQKPPR